MRKLKLDELPLGTLLCGGLLVCGCVLFGWWSAAHAAIPPAREIHLVANGLDFAPRQITLKKGQPVTLVISAQQAPLRFEAPSLSRRAELMPGQVARLALTPMQSGSFGFDCGAYCIAGSDDARRGMITVID